MVKFLYFLIVLAGIVIIAAWTPWATLTAIVFVVGACALIWGIAHKRLVMSIVGTVVTALSLCGVFTYLPVGVYNVVNIPGWIVAMVQPAPVAVVQAPVQQSVVPPVVDAPPVVAPPAVVEKPVEEPVVPYTLNCGTDLTAPMNGQVFPAYVNGVEDKRKFAVVFDPVQGGSADHPALGWYYQPCLPTGPDRVAHDVSLVLQAPANYRFTGPECRVYLNTDGNSPWEKGKLLINRQNVLSISVSETSGHKGEVWIGVKCAASWASGFSFEKLP